ncbi:hypothetical protein CHGG_10770 [Chaetomium globosum CBS 148.51]|uniref:Protein kinase domain-containing protein n=1 Tax=Chaetomium globosum (strain ATCC 6205 / CBS 148.51 / DSM 1962 / NBRC 6347 / NRRL 1970) TaxID=306901 RepID=Q2GMN4_CHAGB|nr:uncharacterized protein CHGG_10770 [Chaetomium globosum CBS 148.51]EAQ82952.1 hypothetical protein CHGG_10770 [Chaetomium globosum CBS 148.51]
MGKLALGKLSCDQNLLSSLLAQMCELVATIPNELSMLSNLAQGQEPSFELLFRAVTIAVQQFRQIFIVIDALDECLDGRRLIATLRNMMYWDLDGMHLFLSSRSFPPIQAFLETIDHSRYITIGDSNRFDIENFIHQRLGERFDHRPGTEAEVLDNINKRVAAKAGGMFLWAKLALEQLLENAYSTRDMVDMLDRLPRTLDEMYARLISTHLHQSSSTPALVPKVLIWVGYARRPLRIEEVAEAVALDVTAAPIVSPQRQFFRSKDVLRICPELTRTVTIQNATESHEALALVHVSLRDYMDIRLSSLNPHVEMARACLQYLCLLDQPDTLNSLNYLQRFPLANYAARFWHYHMQAADHTRGDLGPILSAATDFFRGSNIYVQNWVKLFDPDRPWISQPDISSGLPNVSTPLYYASCLGLPALVRDLLDRRDGGDINATGGAHGTALQAAAYHGNLAIVKILLESGADPFIRCGLHGTALQAAKFVGHVEITEVLQARMRERDTGEAGQDAGELDLPRHIVLSRGDTDPYEWRKELGSGAMGYVDMVESRASGSLCVRKTIRPGSAEERQRLVQVVQLMETLNHVHIVNVLGSYSIRPEFYILMNPVAQWDLKRYMAGQGGAVVNPRNLARWIGCLARGLSYIHRKRVKHKDIKPSNLLVDGDNILYTDFDLAHRFQSLDDVTTGRTSQTVSYSAPEVAEGGERTPATDVFSLGCVYVEMLTVITGSRVFDIFHKLPGERGYNFRGHNNAVAVAWLEGLSFGNEQEKYGEAVRLTRQMISEVRPDAETLSRRLGALACDLCALP